VSYTTTYPRLIMHASFIRLECSSGLAGVYQGFLKPRDT
jgi:hypothetical protein